MDFTEVSIFRVAKASWNLASTASVEVEAGVQVEAAKFQAAKRANDKHFRHILGVRGFRSLMWGPF